MTRTTATKHMSMSTPLSAFYIVVLTLAMVGQYTAARQWIKLPSSVPDVFAVLITGGFVAVLELGAVALLQEVVRRRQRGASAWVPLSASVGVVSVATVITVVGHWGDTAADQISSVAFGLVTVLGYLVWLITSDLAERPEHVRRRRVRAAVTVYVRSLPGLNAEEKGVLLASLGADDIASQVCAGLDNDRIAAILGTAIAPSRWDIPINSAVPQTRPATPSRPSPRRAEIPQPVTGVDVPTPVRPPAIPRPPHPMAQTETVPSPHGVPGRAPADPVPAEPMLPIPAEPIAEPSKPAPVKPAPKPSKQPKAKTSTRDEEIKAALRQLAAGEVWNSQREIAAHFNLSTSQLSRIKQRTDLVKVNGS